MHLSHIGLNLHQYLSQNSTALTMKDVFGDQYSKGNILWLAPHLFSGFQMPFTPQIKVNECYITLFL